MLNNPLRYADPTGHQRCGDGERVYCNGTLNTTTPPPTNPSGGGGGNGGGGNNDDDDGLPDADPDAGGDTSAGNTNICAGNGPYIPAFTCQGIITDPVTITVANVDPGVPEDAGLPMEGYTQPTGFDYLSAFRDGLMWVYYNTPAYSWATKSNAQAMIGVIHDNQTGWNIMPVVVIRNNTRMNLQVGAVSIDRTPMRSPYTTIPPNSFGIVKFYDRTWRPTMNIAVVINFMLRQGNGGFFGYGQIRYNGPNYISP